jgi:hypothetical protein
MDLRMEKLKEFQVDGGEERPEATLEGASEGHSGGTAEGRFKGISVQTEPVVASAKQLSTGLR